MTNQSDRQQDLRDTAGTTHPFSGDWLAFLTNQGFPTGTLSERMLLWLNSENSITDANLNVAKQRFAASKGFTNWNSMNEIDIAAPGADNELLLEVGAGSLLLEVAAGSLLLETA